MVILNVKSLMKYKATSSSSTVFLSCYWPQLFLLGHYDLGVQGVSKLRERISSELLLIHYLL